MSQWLVVDSLYCAEQYFCSHLDSYGHYLAEFGESVARVCLNQPALKTIHAAWPPPYANATDALKWLQAWQTYDFGLFLDGYAQAMAWPCEKRIAQVAAVCSPMPWDVRKPDGSPAFSLVISSIPWMVQASIDAGTPARYQPLCFDLRARACMMGVKRDLDCIFIGSTGGNHVRRTRLLEELKDVVTVLPPVFGREYFRTLARAKVVLNVHAEWAQGAANAMRLFEAGGMGAAVCSDGNPPREMGAGWWRHPTREEILWSIRSDAVPRSTNTSELVVLTKHTYEKRIPQLIEWARSL